MKNKTFRIHTQSGDIEVLSPAGLVTAVLRPWDQVQLVHIILTLHLQRAQGQALPPSVDIEADAPAVPMQPVQHPTNG